MGQLFDRVSRVVRANLNASRGEFEAPYQNLGTPLVAGGAIAGASIGKVGILASGTGYSLGAVPLAAFSALTGAALYEALRSLIEGDTSAGSAAAIGAGAGAATSTMIGGVGIAAGGSAIGVGMASMAAGGAVVCMGLVGLNRLLRQGIDPEKLLDHAIEQMEADVQSARRAMIDVIAAQRRIQQQYKQAQAEVNNWQQRVYLALQNGDEALAREALFQKKMKSGILKSLESQLEEPASVKTLKHTLTRLEAKITEAKAMRTRLKAQIAEARATNQLQSTGRLGISSAMAAFERMDEKVLHMEARSQAAAELAGDDLECQFARLTSGDVDDELVVMKAQLLGGTRQSQPQLPNSVSSNPLSIDASVDRELENLKIQLDQI